MTRASSISLALLLVAAPVAAADSAERSFLHAEGILREGKTQEARDAFRRVVQSYPESRLADDALYRLATMDFHPAGMDVLTRRHVKGSAEAFPLLENIRSDYGESDRAADARYLQGLAHLVPGSKVYDLDRAFAAFREVVDVHAESEAAPAALRATAAVELRAGHPGRALLYLERLLVEHPAHPEASRARLDVAQAYLRLGLVREALVRLAPLQSGSGPEAEAALDLGTLLTSLDITKPSGVRAPRKVPEFLHSEGSLRGATSMAVDGQGRLHILADNGKNILRLNAAGGIEEERAVQNARLLFRESGGAIGWASADTLHLSSGTLHPVGKSGKPLNDMIQVAVGADGTFLVLEGRGSEVLWLNANGRFRKLVAEPRGAVDLALDRQGWVYILDARTREILVREPNGRDRGTMQLSADPARVQTPLALAVDDAYHVYVLDGKTKDILILGDAGRLLARLHADPDSAEAMRDPKTFTVSNSGALFAYDARVRVVRSFR